MNELTQDYVRSLFNYRDGNLYWKIARTNCIKVGNLAGCIRNSDYSQIGIDGKLYKTHRLVFLYHYGYFPQFLDHIDGNKLNNDINNLRKATNQENQRNRKKNKSYNCKPTSSKYKGVGWHKYIKKWRARIAINGKDEHLGYFKSEIDAAMAYDKVAIEEFGEFAKVNFV